MKKTREKKLCTNLTAWLLAGLAVVATVGCGSDDGSAMMAVGSDLTKRAYIISEEHEDLTVIDLNSLSIIAKVATAGVGNHMAELNADFTKAYVSSPDTNEVIVVDTQTFKVIKRLSVGAHPTHLTLSRDGNVLAVMCEVGNAVAFIDPKTDEPIKALRGFYTPHFLRYAKDGKFAYVANLGAHHITRVDMSTLTIESEIPLDGMTVPTMAPDEGGFADAQIANDGILYAADRATGRVFVYDTIAKQRLPEQSSGPHPWIVYAEHPFTNVPVRMVPNWGDMTVSMFDTTSKLVMNVADAGDHDSNGVNYTSLDPNKAFVMNRLREDIAVVDTKAGTVTARIPVGGNTETASTTPDGKWVVATVSSAGSVVVIDAMTNAIVKRFDGLGKYPWSVTIPYGQNYCH